MGKFWKEIKMTDFLWYTQIFFFQIIKTVGPSNQSVTMQKKVSRVGLYLLLIYPLLINDVKPYFIKP